IPDRANFGPGFFCSASAGCRTEAAADDPCKTCCPPSSRSGPIAAGLALLAGSPAGAKFVTDRAGRRVEIPDRSQRVVSLAPSITEIVFALGQKRS
ncbi:MAG: hypothetical protein MZV70_19220, partial [Desulfobacterales bacterium]|nr:hypothetical protein [Desulfobacterales bacterium]